MSAISPKIGQAAVASIYKNCPQAKVIGIKTDRVWQGDMRLSVEGTEFRVELANSVLQIRELLLAGEEDLPLVILTDLEQSALGNDLLARFAKRRLWSIKPWPIIADLFQAKAVAPSLHNKKWLAEALLERLASQNFPTVASGMVDEDTVWRIVLKLYLDIEQARPDTWQLLEWTLQEDSIKKFLNLNPDMQPGISQWLEQSAGRLGKQILNTIRLGYGKDAIAIGLTLHVVLSEPNNLALRDARIRLERFTGNKLEEDIAKQWAKIAGGILRKLYKNNDIQQVIALTQRADEILYEIDILKFAYLSDYSPKGFEMRFEQYANSLKSILAFPKSSGLDEQVNQIGFHWQANWPDQQDRVLRVTMSLRLVHWLENFNDKQDFASLQEVADKYLSDISYVDVARQTLYQGDNEESLSQIYAQLLKIVTEKRESFNQKFAKLLANWTEAGSRSNSLLKVEEILKQVVAPVAQAEAAQAKTATVLLIVADGLSYAIFHEILADINVSGWSLLVPETSSGSKAVIAALPSITETSRTSLLCGQLLAGNSGDEINGFKTNPDLLKVSKANARPILFHKNNLTENGQELAKEVCTEIANPKRQVVGVVLNAVDDHLAKSEQIAIKWNLQSLPILAQLLESARDAGRIVVLTSDHGHILERGTVYRKATPGERFRANDGVVMPDELSITGSRVLKANNSTLIFPWSELVRYANKKCGYHGGVTPQEIIVPLAVLAWNNKAVKGWKELTPLKPSWWNTPTDKNEASYTNDNDSVNKNSLHKIKRKSTLPLLDIIEESSTEE